MSTSLEQCYQTENMQTLHNAYAFLLLWKDMNSFLLQKEIWEALSGYLDNVFWLIGFNTFQLGFVTNSQAEIPTVKSNQKAASAQTFTVTENIFLPLLWDNCYCSYCYHCYGLWDSFSWLWLS